METLFMEKTAVEKQVPTVVEKIFVEVLELAVVKVPEPTFGESTFVLVPTVVESIFPETTVVE
eukprot:1726648-Pyramimonas_sp.AAC.1